MAERLVAWAGITPPPSAAEFRALDVLKRTQGYAPDFVFAELRSAGLRIVYAEPASREDGAR